MGEQKRWAHLVAIGGTGMGALASLLQDLNFVVTGSDGPLYPPMSTFLQSRNIPIRNEYQAENLDGSSWGIDRAHPDLVIIGNAISKGNLEAVRTEELLQNKKISRMSFAQALAEYCIGAKKSYVVTGTHGKTTTTSLFAWILESLGADPSFFIGGIPKNFNQGCRLTKGSVFVAEGDEYDTAYWDKESKFLHYRPDWVLCTGIEFDHADIYSDITQIENMFIKLIAKTRCGWLLIDESSAPKPASVERVASALRAAGKPVYRYGTHCDADFRLVACETARLPWNAEIIGTKITVKVKASGAFAEVGEMTFYSPMCGQHNALNVVGILGTLVAGGDWQGVAAFQAALVGFKGIKRRQDEVYVSPQLIVIDDFAHHPTAILETILAIRGRYPDRKIAAFFEPRSATSARNILAHEFAACFDQADSVFLTPPTKVNIPLGQKLDIEAVISEMTARPAHKGHHIVSKSNVEELVQAFAEWRKNTGPAVALVMSNGPFGGIHDKLAKAAV